MGIGDLSFRTCNSYFLRHLEAASWGFLGGSLLSCGYVCKVLRLDNLLLLLKSSARRMITGSAEFLGVLTLI